MVDRMQVHKMRDLEQLGWYRENSVRFVRFMRPRPLFSAFVTLVAIPGVFINWAIYAKEAEQRHLGLDVHYQVNPLGRISEIHRGDNAGHPSDYIGPEEALQFSK